MLNNKIKEIILIILIMIVMLPNYVSAVTINLGNNPPAGKCDAYMIGTILFGLICVLIVDRLWLEHGKDNKAPETIEKYPPKGLNPLEVGFAYKGIADDKDVVSLLVYLANKGYITIETIEKKILFFKRTELKITKLKEYDGDNESEKTFMRGLFAIDEEVTNEILKNRFFRTVRRIKEKENKKENKKKIKNEASKEVNRIIDIMILSIFALISVVPLIKWSGFTTIFLVVPSVAGYIFLRKEINKEERDVLNLIFSSIIAAMFLFVPLIAVHIVLAKYEPLYIVMNVIGIVFIIILEIFRTLMPKRTKFGTEMFGKIKGFQRFLENAKKEELEDIVKKEPTYFYDVLPYAYVLGMSNKLIKQFESITMEKPAWAVQEGEFDSKEFNKNMKTVLKAAKHIMTSNPNSGISLSVEN